MKKRSGIFFAAVPRCGPAPEAGAEEFLPPFFSAVYLPPLGDYSIMLPTEVGMCSTLRVDIEHDNWSISDEFQPPT